MNQAKARADVAVRIDGDIATQIRLVSAHKKISSVKILSRILRNPVRKAYKQVLAELHALTEEG